MIIWLTILAVIAAIMVSIFARIDNWQRDWTENFAELDPAAEDPELRPLQLELTPTQVADAIEVWVGSQPRWQWVTSEAGPETTTIELTRQTALMRFVDDVRVKITSDERGSRVVAESQSRLGKGDLGQNPRNLKELVRGLREST